MARRVPNPGRYALALLACTPGLGAQARVSLPDAAARASAHDAFLEVVARVSVQPAGAESAIAALLRAAQEEAPAVGFLLLDQAERCARAAHDLPSGLAVADVRSERFSIEPRAARAQCLARFTAAAAVPAQVLVGAHLDEAERLLEDPDDAGLAHLEAARRLAVGATSRALADWTARRSAELRGARQAYAACAAAPDDSERRARYEACFRGHWSAGLQAMQGAGGRPQRVAAFKLGAEAPRDENVSGARALTAAAEEWLSQSVHESALGARRSLLRRSMQLLAQAQRVPEVVEEDPLEGQRSAALLERTTTQLAGLATPGVDTLRFTATDACEQMLITGGEWRLDGGCLVGRNTGAATRATTRFAWRSIDCVRILGGIRSADALNFRVAVGRVNLLFNWEVADENHFYVGESCSKTSPRRLQAGREHRIELRQVGDEVVVTVDDTLLGAMTGTLAGTVSVYPALGSEIFVRAIDVVGDIDLGTVVSGPSAPAR
ncbi:MAG: hypothetical protein R3F56_14570 [Planctomycetota bacterium]